MKHSHHHCECDHSSVKYCKTCKVVHCLDCNQEWRTYHNFTYTTSYPWYNTLGGGAYGNSGQTGLMSSQDAQLTTTACNHTD